MEVQLAKIVEGEGRGGRREEGRLWKEEARSACDFDRSDHIIPGVISSSERGGIKGSGYNI